MAEGERGQSGSMPEADADRIAALLHSLDDLQSNIDMTILSLSGPISSASETDHQQRMSDISNASFVAPTPASLEADLGHYRELFAKLRFSYVEQVTKEKFIRAIVGDPPLIVSAADNAVLEARNVAAKAALKALKADVAAMVGALETRARELSSRYARVQTQCAVLRGLPARMAELDARIAELRARQQVPDGDGPEMHMPMQKTLALVGERRRRRAELQRTLDQLAAQVPRKRKEAERLAAELGPLEAKRSTSTTAAREARRKRLEGAEHVWQDDAEERGRWWLASEAALSQMLDLAS